MSASTPSTKKSHLPEITFGIAVIRGTSAFGVGMLLLFYPEKSASFLVNTMGFFWLFTGIALIRRCQDDPTVKMLGHRTSRIVAVVGAVAGLLVVTRSITRQAVPEGTFFVLLGTVILLTGLVHLTAAIRFGSAVNTGHRWLGILLGIFEIALGLMLVISPLDRGPVTYWIATIWALAFGVMVISDAVLNRSQTHKTAQKRSAEDDSLLAEAGPKT